MFLALVLASIIMTATDAVKYNQEHDKSLASEQSNE